MGFEILTLSPLWYIILCLLAALAFTWLLYRKSFFEKGMALNAMKFLRFLGLFLVFALLLGPMVKLRLHREQKPLLLFFMDRSSSIADSTAKNIEQQTSIAASGLKDKYDVRLYNFAGTVARLEDTLSEPNATSIPSIYDYVNEVFEGKTLAGLVVLSDGISNRGMNPLFKKLDRPAPVYTLGLGDTVQYPDVWISSLEANSTVFIENEFNVEVGIRSSGLDVSAVNVELLEDGKRIQTQTWQKPQGKDVFAKMQFFVKPSSPGLKQYQVRLSPVPGEHNAFNNVKSVWVSVTDTRRRIAIISHAPNPDVAAITRALEENVQYTINRFEPNNLPPFSAFDIAICHGFPASSNEMIFLKSLQNSKKPFWVIFSGQTLPGLLQNSDFGLDIGAGSGTNDVQGFVSENFNEFIIEDLFISSIKNWPPLHSPYGRYRTAVGFKPFIMQKIGSVNTDMPLMGFSTLNNSRQAWLFGEGIWRWRLKDFEMTKNHVFFDEFVSKTLQFLGTDEVKQKFRAFTEDPQMNSLENVVVLAEYLDQNMELDNRKECELEITGPENFKRNLIFAKNNQRYRADLGALPSGNYKFRASVKGGSGETASGTFSISSQSIEQENTVADHGLLRRMSAATGGAFFPQQNWSKLVQTFKNKTSVNNVIVEDIRVTELINWKWFFALIVLFFSAEWFLRKREGGY